MPTERLVIVYDAGAVTEPDAATLDALARLLLAARRIGASVEVRNPRRELVDLLTLVGLAGELGLEPSGESEEWEQAGVDEEVDGGDASV